jgi:hypothetical protein
MMELVPPGMNTQNFSSIFYILEDVWNTLSTSVERDLLPT